MSIEVSFPDRMVLPDDLRVFGHGPLQGQVSIEEEGTVLYKVEEMCIRDRVECVENPSACSKVENCSVRDVWETLYEKIAETLESVSLEDFPHILPGLNGLPVLVQDVYKRQELC